VTFSTVFSAPVSGTGSQEIEVPASPHQADERLVNAVMDHVRLDVRN